MIIRRDKGVKRKRFGFYLETTNQLRITSYCIVCVRIVAGFYNGYKYVNACNKFLSILQVSCRTRDKQIVRKENLRSYNGKDIGEDIKLGNCTKIDVLDINTKYTVKGCKSIRHPGIFRFNT